MDAEEQKQSNTIRSRWMADVEAREKGRKRASSSLTIGGAFMALIFASAAITAAYSVLTPDPAISMMDVLPFQVLAFMLAILFTMGALLEG